MTELSAVDLRSPPEPAIVRWPRAWYVVARSHRLRPGAIVDGAIADRPFVIFRTAGGALAALDAHCPHMGAHLRHGSVVGEELRCGLHHWMLDRDGHCRGPGAGPGAAAKAWPVAERLGLVFLYPGQDEPPPLPLPAEVERFGWITGRPVELDTDWRAMMVNGFDLLHLGAVHHRELLPEPSFVRGDRTLELHYTSRVATGGGVSDWAMKRISGDRIRVHQTCHGPVIVVESDLGRTRTAAVLGLLPTADGVRAFGAFGSERGPGLVVRRWASRWLFTAFLKKDFAVVEQMRLRLGGVPDRGVREVASFLGSLPGVAHGS